MRAVTADEREKGREKRAALRTGAGRDHRREVVDLQQKEGQAEEAGHEQRRLRPNHGRAPAPTAESPQVKLEKSRQAVSIATFRG